MKISFIIPCYYSSKNLENVIEELNSTINGLDYDYEIVLVNDGSTDSTFDVICNMAKKNLHIKGVDLAINSGQHNAIMAGMNYCDGDYVMILSDDGQTPLNVISEMAQTLDNGYDAVCVRYISRKKRSLFRKIGTKVNSSITNWLIPSPRDVKFSIDLMMKKCIVNEIVKYEGPYTYFPGLLFRTTQKVKNIEAEQKGRISGESGYTIKKLVKLFMDGFTAFSVKPLRISAKLGALFSLGGLVGIIYTVIRKIVNHSVQVGWSSIIVLLLLIGGIIMIMLGLIGEYIGRIYMCINKAPQFVVRETINITQNEKKDID